MVKDLYVRKCKEEGSFFFVTLVSIAVVITPL
jgi:hypothetical protein